MLWEKVSHYVKEVRSAVKAEPGGHVLALHWRVRGPPRTAQVAAQRRRLVVLKKGALKPVPAQYQPVQRHVVQMRPVLEQPRVLGQLHERPVQVLETVGPRPWLLLRGFRATKVQQIPAPERVVLQAVLCGRVVRLEQVMQQLVEQSVRLEPLGHKVVGRVPYFAKLVPLALWDQAVVLAQLVRPPWARLLPLAPEKAPDGAQPRGKLCKLLAKQRHVLKKGDPVFGKVDWLEIPCAEHVCVGNCNVEDPCMGGPVQAVAQTEKVLCVTGQF